MQNGSTIWWHTKCLRFSHEQRTVLVTPINKLHKLAASTFDKNTKALAFIFHGGAKTSLCLGQDTGSIFWPGYSFFLEFWHRVKKKKSLASTLTLYIACALVDLFQMY